MLYGALCPKCRGYVDHSESRGFLYCKKCGSTNAVTLKKAILLSETKKG